MTVASWGGAYALATYATSGGGNNGYYFGIRRVPYSTDLAKNALTFKHIQYGTALPVGLPINDEGVPNSQVHNPGEVWATMLWECYAVPRRDTLGANPRLTLQQAQERMKLYFVTSLKLTPVSPTFTEARGCQTFRPLTR
jgi:large repetitive protein